MINEKIIKFTNLIIKKNLVSGKYYWIKNQPYD